MIERALFHKISIHIITYQKPNNSNIRLVNLKNIRMCKMHIRPSTSKNRAINFCILKIKSFFHYQTDYMKEWVKNCCDGGLLIVENFLLKERRIGSAITELCSQKQVLIENVRSRYSNRTVTLIEYSSTML